MQMKMAERQGQHQEILSYLGLITEEQKGLVMMCTRMAGLAAATGMGPGMGASMWCKLDDIKTHLSRVKHCTGGQSGTNDLGGSPGHEITSLQERIWLLQALVSFTPLTFGGETFSSLPDVSVYGLVTCLQMCTTCFMMKSGFSKVYLIHSFQGPKCWRSYTRGRKLVQRKGSHEWLLRSS